MQFEQLGTAEIQRKKETDAELARHNKLAREEPLKNYMEAYLTSIVNSSLKKTGREHLIPLVGGSIVMNLMGAYRIAIEELLPSSTSDHDLSKRDYPAAFEFIQAAVRLVNGAKFDLENKRPNEVREAYINYGPILAKLRVEFGEPGPV